MKKILTLLVLLSTTNLYGQLQNATWCFPIDNRMDFNLAPPAPSVLGSQIHFGNTGNSIACASVSDENGQLRFYTDGITVWDKNNTIMSNGTDLYGYSDLFSQQRVVIVPKPDNADIYYIIELGTIGITGGGLFVGRGGIHYSVVDMSIGSGQVTQKNIPLTDINNNPIDYAFDYSQTNNNPYFITPKSRITTTLNDIGDKVWVAVIAVFYYQGVYTRKLMNYQVSSTGIGIAPQQEITLTAANYNNNTNFDVASMKISPNGKLLSDAEDVVNLYDYDNHNGTISNYRRVYTSFPTAMPLGYGIDFSPNNKLLYFSYVLGFMQSGFLKGNTNSLIQKHEFLFQYYIPKDYLQTIYSDTSLTTDRLNSNNIITPFPLLGTYALQLAMDRKIYLCLAGPNNVYIYKLGVINNPDIQGIGCQFVPDQVSLLNNHNLILPQWVHKRSCINLPLLN